MQWCHLGVQKRPAYLWSLPWKVCPLLCWCTGGHRPQCCRLETCHGPQLRFPNLLLKNTLVRYFLVSFRDYESQEQQVRSSVAFWLTDPSFYSVTTLRADCRPLWCHPSNPCDSTTDAFFPCLPPPGGSLTLSFGFCIQECKGGTKEGQGNCKGAATSQSCCDSSSFRDWWEQWHSDKLTIERVCWDFSPLKGN